jgi:hypothetical protein
MESTVQKPSVGRIVHYVSYGTPGGEYKSECRAAIVTGLDNYKLHGEDVNMGCVHLAVLNPEGMFFNKSVCHDEDQAGGSWHWPERV